MRAVTCFSIVALSTIFLFPTHSQAQQTGISGRNTITSAVPFLNIVPDTRSGGMADAGIAIPADANTTFHNPSKLAFMEHDIGGSISYTPWLRQLVPDMNLSYLSGYKRIDDLSTFGVSMRYFSMGDIQFTDQNGQELGQFRPYEFAVSGSYGRKLSDQFSVGLSLRYIHSNLAGNQSVGQGTQTQPGNAVSGDISAYWKNDGIELLGKEADIAFGANMRNIGSKVTYTDETDEDFIPMNLGLGSYVNFHIDEYNEIALVVDFNKLLVPTPPEYARDSNGRLNTGPNNNLIVERGIKSDVPVMQGLIQSFYDAPGGFEEEMREIKPSIGVEYWYDQQFALRTGYFYEHETKGNRQFLTLGAGIRYSKLGLDFSYLVPTNASRRPGNNSPLQNTIRLTLHFNFASEEGEG